MKNLTEKFKTLRNLKTIEGVRTTVVITALSSNSTTDISEYIISIGKIENRLEADLNDPVISTVALEVKNEATQEYPFITSGEVDGLFDKLFSGAVDNYQIKIRTVIDNATDEPLEFDGRIDSDSIEIKDYQNSVSFTAYGWLEKAKDTNAEGVADPNAPPLRNITGVSVYQTEGYTAGYIGVRTLEFTPPGTLRLNGGRAMIFWNDQEKRKVYGRVCGYITVDIDYSELPAETKTDEFTVIEHNGYLRPCFWYENRSLEFIVEKIFDELEITEQDINVEAINSGEWKRFEYFAKFFSEGERIDSKITALKVVDYDDATNIIQMVFWIEVREGSSRLYHIAIDINNGNYETTRIVNTVYRGLKFFELNNRVWTITAEKISGFDSLTADSDTRYAGMILHELAADWKSRTYIEALASDLPDPDPVTDNTWSFFLGYSASDHQEYMYIAKQKKVSGTYHLYLHKYIAASHAWAPPVALEVSGDTEIVAYDYADVMLNNNSHIWYVYTAKRKSDTTYTSIHAYDIPDDNFIEIKYIDGTVARVQWSQKTVEAHNNHQLYMKFAVGGAPKNLLIKNDGTWSEDIFTLQYVGSSRQENDIFTSFYGSNLIVTIDASLGFGSWRSEFSLLDEDYSPEMVAAKIYKNSANFGYFYAGLCIDKTDNGIVPYIYRPYAKVKIKKAYFKNMSCKETLRQLAEAYLCTFNIYEKNKARFYYRETKLDSMNLDVTNYTKENIKIEYKQAVDGVIIENSKDNLIWKKGNISYGKNVIHIDNSFISSQMGDEIVNWYYDFFNKSRRIIILQSPLLLEAELMDEIILKLRDRESNIFYELNTLVYEKSYKPSPFQQDSFLIDLKLQQIGGLIVHKRILEDDIESIGVETA